MDSIKPEQELENVKVVIDVDKLVNSKIKHIIIKNSDLQELKCLDSKKQLLRKQELFNCLKFKDIPSAKKLNKLYQTHIWALLDEDVKKDMNFKDFVD
jgi:hypothetical protein